MNFIDVYRMWDYYTRMAELYWTTDWTCEEQYVKYCQFVWLSEHCERQLEVMCEV